MAEKILKNNQNLLENTDLQKLGNPFSKIISKYSAQGLLFKFANLVKKEATQAEENHKFPRNVTFYGQEKENFLSILQNQKLTKQGSFSIHNNQNLSQSEKIRNSVQNQHSTSNKAKHRNSIPDPIRRKHTKSQAQKVTNIIQKSDHPSAKSDYPNTNKSDCPCSTKSDSPNNNNTNNNVSGSLYNCKTVHQRFTNCNRTITVNHLIRKVIDYKKLFANNSIIMNISIAGYYSSIAGRTVLKQKLSTSYSWKNYVPIDVATKNIYTVQLQLKGRIPKAEGAIGMDEESARGSNTGFQDQAQVQKGMIRKVSSPIEKPLISPGTPSDYKYLDFSGCTSKHREYRFKLFEFKSKSSRIQNFDDDDDTEEDEEEKTIHNPRRKYYYLLAQVII